ncbi:MAG: hypothetical protein Q8Q26_04035 [Pseudorhodobacter sp.]|nr:hypothetical protein [Pseudorhodobacter sp.]
MRAGQDEAHLTIALATNEILQSDHPDAAMGIKGDRKVNEETKN